MKIITTVLILLSLIIGNAVAGNAQQCVGETRQTFLECVSAAIADCADSSGGLCSSEDATNATVAETVLAKVELVCCALNGRGQKVSCVTRAINAARKARPLFDATTMDELLAQLRELKRAVKDTGECPSEEPA